MHELPRVAERPVYVCTWLINIPLWLSSYGGAALLPVRHLEPFDKKVGAAVVLQILHAGYVTIGQ
jgi:hypothetical protein